MHKCIHLLMVLLQYLSMGLIRFYQHYLSPHKGFCCAYRKHSGGRSCSNFALVVIRRYGISALWLSFPKRLEQCKTAALRLDDEKKKKNCKYCDVLEIPCEYCEGFDMPCDCADGCSCDLSINKPSANRRGLAISPFFLLIWLYQRSLKKRHK